MADEVRPGAPDLRDGPLTGITVVDILLGIARMQHGDWEVLRALAREERRTADVFPVF